MASVPMDYRGQMTAAIEAVRVHSATRFSWLGRRSARLPPHAERAMTARARRRYLLDGVAGRLYVSFYASGGQARREAPQEQPPPRDRPFLAALSDANRGTGPWDAGWTVVSLGDGHVSVRKDGLALRVPRVACRPHDRGMPLGPGARVRVRYPKDLPAMSPGYYTALGDRPWTDAEERAVLRFYWHLTAEGAPLFVRCLTERLNARGVPHRLKILDHPSGYSRCDAGVLYLPRSRYRLALPDLREACSALGPFLLEPVPALTLSVAPGVGFAEDPPGDDSFGMHRCRLLAQGLVLAHERGLRSTETRLEAVLGAFRDTGVDPARPYLNPGSPGEVEPFDAAG